MHINFENRYDFEKNSKIICPHCENHNEDYLFYDNSKDDGDEIISAIVECTHCHKNFKVNLDKYNQSEGFSTTPVPCKKHSFSFYKKVSGDNNVFFNKYTCKKCWETDFRELNESGNELTESELQSRYFNSQLVNKETSIKKEGTIFFSEDTVSVSTKNPEGNRDLFLSLMKYLKKIGFVVSNDKNIKYKSLNNYFKHGQWKELEFDANYYPAGLDIKFYQNAYPGERGPGQGKYEFDKKEKMPFLLKKRLEFTISKLVAFLKSDTFSLKEKEFSLVDGHGRANLDDPSLTIYDKIKRIKSINYSADNGSGFNFIDKNNKKIINGDIKFFYDYDGYLRKGEAYLNLNNMWWILTKDNYFNKASYELFDYNGEPIKRKKHKEIIQTKLNEAIKSQDFEKCIILRDILKNKYKDIK